MPLNGKAVVVTGGTGALGAAVVARVLAEGGRCIVPVHRRKEGESDPGITYVDGIDLTHEASVEELYQGTPGLWASVHTAGSFAMSPIDSAKKSDFDQMMQTNALSAFLCCREAARRMRGRGGRIVNVAARAALQPGPGMVAYNASKAAVASITQTLAAELAPDGILINAVLPSVMDTLANRKAFPPGTDYSMWPKVEEVAAAIAFLISPENSLTSGALVPVYGRA